MADYYHDQWLKARMTEGASQRVQEDTIKFSRIMESLGTSLIEAIIFAIEENPNSGSLPTNSEFNPLLLVKYSLPSSELNNKLRLFVFISDTLDIMFTIPIIQKSWTFSCLNNCNLCIKIFL